MDGRGTAVTGDGGKRLGRRLALSGVLLGIGAAGALDEIVFHQLLHWHHFYDRADQGAALLSDGLLHAGTWAATVAGLGLLLAIRRPLPLQRWWAAVLIGAGGFQLWDGVVHHKLLRLHQVRYGVDPTAYDLAWNVAGLLLLLAGSLLLRGSARREAPTR